MNPVGIGIVGCGPIAQAAHLPATVKAANATLIAVCDRSERLRTAAQSMHGASIAYADAADLFADTRVEAVIIAVADPFHVPLAIAALHAGKHVLVEKPLSDTHPSETNPSAPLVFRACPPAGRTSLCPPCAILFAHALTPRFEI